MSAAWMGSQTRADVYGMLCALFRDEPTRAVVEPIVNPDRFEAIRADLDMIGATAAVGSLDRLRDDLVGLAWSAPDEAPFVVRREYADLFLRKGAIHPYESVYRGEDKRLMDWPWEQVRSVYRASGFAVDTSEIHPEDHISVELGFMAIMSHAAFDASLELLESLLEIQRPFLVEHLLTWLPDLVVDVIGSESSTIYKAIARFTLDFVNADLTALDAMQHGMERREK